MQNLAQAAERAEQPDVAMMAYRRMLALAPEHRAARQQLNRLADGRLGQCMLEIESLADNFTVYHRRPVHAAGYWLRADAMPSESIAIVLQGPLLDYQDFTLETVRLYRTIFPFAAVIVSTWDDTPPGAISTLQAAGAQTVLSPKPAFAGFKNVNLQLHSTMAGLKLAHGNHCRYVLKSRTDYRIYNPRFFLDALDLVETFPLPPHAAALQQHRLLTFSDLNRYAIYAIYDRNMFGTVDDMLAYWNAPHDMRPDPERLDSLRDIARFGAAETYMLTRFMARLGRPLQWNLADHWQILRDHFVVMDQAAADFYWCKYERFRAISRYLQYEYNSNIQPFGFADWLRLYHGKRIAIADDRIIDRPHAALIDDLLAEAKNAEQP
ncbi:MAG TPA: WavE lipopolysaccharide synthesis family protein, partial [Pseudoduganella sp.]